MEYFKYGEKELRELCEKDGKLAEIIGRLGHVDREIITDFYTCTLHKIIGQQISNSALATVFARLTDIVGEITPENISRLSDEELQKCGTTFKKISYIRNFTNLVLSGEVSYDKLKNLDDETLIKELVKIKGIGRWTAEMILISSFGRGNIISYGDLIIQKGLRMIYGKEEITPEFFAEIKQRFSPYCTVASFYIWKVGGGAIPELTDPKPKKEKKEK